MAAVDNPPVLATETDIVREPRSPVLFLEPPELVEEWLVCRRALGQDRFDEVWEGEYRVVSGPASAHGDVDAQLAALLQAPGRAVGLWPVGQFNVGRDHRDYRVPDRGFLRERVNRVWNPTAAIVVEILSPRDPAYEKFDFYHRHEVEELLVVDPLRRAVEWYAAASDGFARAGRSALLAITEDELAAAIDWPPTGE